jgi:hypothetical protein
MSDGDPIILGQESYAESETTIQSRVDGLHVFSPSGDAVRYGVVGEVRSRGGAAIEGRAIANDGDAVGVSGRSNGSEGTGVFGFAGGSGPVIGVRGYTTSRQGIGVEGDANTLTGAATGVHGRTPSPDGTGVHGENRAASGRATGVLGTTASPGGTAVRGEATSETGRNFGVQGLTDSSTGIGVQGGASAANGGNIGVAGFTFGTTGIGVLGCALAESDSADYGVFGTTMSPEGYGVYCGGRFKSTGRTFTALPNTPPDDADLDPGSMSMWLDEGRLQLTFRIKDSQGRLWSHAINLVR